MVKSSLKGKIKKKWYPIIAPKMFNEVEIGESHLYDSQSAVGRFVKVNLMNITNDMKNQSISVKFQIIKSNEGRLITKIAQYEVIPAAVKRLVRRRQERIDDSFTANTADGVSLRVKPLVITRGKTSSAVIKDIRKAIKKELTKIINTSNYDNVFSNIVYKKTQKSLKEKVSKVYPIKFAEIRLLKQEGKMTPVSSDSTKEEKEVVEEESKKVEEKTPVKKTAEKEEKPKKEKKAPKKKAEKVEEVPAEVIEE